MLNCYIYYRRLIIFLEYALQSSLGTALYFNLQIFLGVFFPLICVVSFCYLSK